MGTIRCPGGHNIPDIVEPNPLGFMLISEENLETAIDELVEMHRARLAVQDFDDRAGVSIRSHGAAAFVCPDCARLIVFENGLDKPFTSYVRE